MRLPHDRARRDDPAGQPDVRGADRPRARRTCSGGAASRTCSPPGGRIYHETHYAPLLRMQGSVREIAVEIVRAGRHAGCRRSSTPSCAATTQGGRARSARRSSTRPTAAATSRSCSRARRREHEVALELQRSLLAGRRCRRRAASRSGVAYRPGGAGARGRRRLVRRLLARAGRARRRSSSATSSAAASAPRRRWASCAAPCARSRRPGFEPGALLEALLDVLAPPRASGRWRRSPTPRSTCGRGTMRYACAGHPPPVLVEPGGRRAVRCGRAARCRSTRTPSWSDRAGGRRASSRRARRSCSTPTGSSSAATARCSAGLDELAREAGPPRAIEAPDTLARRSRVSSPARLRGPTTSACSRCGSPRAPRVCSSHWRDGRTARLPVVPARPRGARTARERTSTGWSCDPPAARTARPERCRRRLEPPRSVRAQWPQAKFPVRAPPRTLSTWPRSDSITCSAVPGANV